jgi:predicted thioesterase
VREEHTAEKVGSGRAPVLATPAMIAVMEAAAVDCIERHLAENQESLGVRVDVEHVAPTPVGMTVTAMATLAHMDGRTATFDVEARDEAELIGKGRHVRVLVEKERFRAKVRAKSPGNGSTAA